MKPWEIEQVPDEYIDAYDAMEIVSSRVKARQAKDNLFRDFRRKMKYRQYLN